MPVFPIVPPQFSPGIGEIPEPGTWLLVATGLGFLSLMVGARALRAKA